MKTIALGAALTLVAATAYAQPSPPADPPSGKPRMPQVCGTCHTVGPGELRGIFENVAFKSRSIQVKIDNATEIVRFDEATLKILDAGEAKAGEALRDIAKGREARIVFVEQDGLKTATLVSFKGPVKIAPEKLVGYAEVERLVASGPEGGGYTLIDSRPLARFQEGAIPTAINLPYPAFDQFVDRLPADKSRLVIFYCAGVTCTMSPKSLQRAETMGYTNAKVYREGMPEWSQRHYGVVSAAALKQAWIDKDIPHVLLDVRSQPEAAAGFIPGAVGTGADAKAVMASLPDKKVKPPIFVYDDGTAAAAATVAQSIVGAGYTNVNVVTGGFASWKAAAYPIASGTMATRVVYAPKPRPGEVPVAEFSRVARDTPANTLILDVRNPDEAQAGMIKGALLVPDEEILARLGEIPKDKRIVTHCMTGVRAEMAYHKLKDKGYDVGFLNAAIEVAGDGSFTITPR